MASGMVMPVINGLRNELNCQIDSRTIPRIAVGKNLNGAAWVRAASSIPPPVSRR